LSNTVYLAIPGVGPNGFNFGFSSNLYWYYIIVLLCCLTIFVVNRLNQSRLGRSWVAMREDEVAAASMGISIMGAKLWAFSLGAVWGGIAGLTFANFQQFVSPESFTLMESVFVVCSVVIGGMGSIPGAIVGALLIQGTPEIIRGFASSGIIPGLSGEQVSAISNYRNLVFGMVMVLMMIWRPQGIIPSKRRAAELTADDDILEEENETLYDAQHEDTGGF
jgi:branched-chain amino acid transport system permease protein